MQFRLSGGAANANPNGSIGDVMSSVQITSDVLRNLFDDISRSEALLGRTEYRKIFIYNSTGARKRNIRLHMSSDPINGVLSLGVDPAGPNATGASITTEDQTPTGVTFFDATDTYSDVWLPLGSLGAGESHAVWIRRVTEQGGQQTVSMTIEADWDNDSVAPGSTNDYCSVGEFYGVTVNSSSLFLIGTARIGFSQIS